MSNDDEHESLSWGYKLLVAGVALILLGTLILAAVTVISIGEGSASIGGIIFIGPFPIVFGSGPNAIWLIMVAVAIAALGLAVWLVIYRRPRKMQG